ncbi:MAG: hypothetical protein DID91_2727704708 [Candidatus Nitrotoga sp. MKT]|nr:MAG: hypothetical protein DID91_2727704708 [Candidatus Nitrotoga sp. MKT]
MDKHWIVSALEYLTQSLEPVPYEINEIDWKASLSPEKKRAQVFRVIRDALDGGRIKRKDPHSKSSKFTEYLPLLG